MQDPYRDENETLRAKNEELEAEIAERRAELDALKREAASDRVVVELERLLDARDRRSRRRWLAGVGVLATGGAVAALLREPPRLTIVPKPVPVPRVGGGTRPGRAVGSGLGGLGALLEKPHLRIVIGADTRVVDIHGDAPVSGMKYRTDGERSPWLTVIDTTGGDRKVHQASGLTESMPALTVHAVGGFTSASEPATSLDLLHIKVGDTGTRYELLANRPGVVEARIEGGFLVGTFAATVRAVRDVDETTQPPDLEVTASFRLPMAPLDPTDTAP